MSMAKFKQNAKAIAGMVGAIVAGLIGYFGPESTTGIVLTLVGVVAAGVITWASPKNTPKSDQGSGDPAEVFYGKH